MKKIVFLFFLLFFSVFCGQENTWKTNWKINKKLSLENVSYKNQEINILVYDVFEKIYPEPGKDNPKKNFIKIEFLIDGFVERDIEYPYFDDVEIIKKVTLNKSRILVFGEDTDFFIVIPNAYRKRYLVRKKQKT